jgi:hypothetical protein
VAHFPSSSLWAFFRLSFSGYYISIEHAVVVDKSDDDPISMNDSMYFLMAQEIVKIAFPQNFSTISLALDKRW